VPRERALDGRLEWRDAGGSWAGDQTFPLVTADCQRLTRAIAFALAVQLQLLATGEASPDRAAAPPDGQVAPGAAARDTVAREAAARAPTPRDAAARDTAARQAAARAPAPREPDAREPPGRARAAGPTPSAVAAIASAPEPAAAVAHAGPELLFGAGSSVAVGLSAGPVLLGRLFAGWTWPHASLELAAQISLPATVRRADGAGFSQQQLLLGLAGCAVVTRWRLCMLVNAGEVRMAGQDIDRPTSAVAPAVQAGARVGAAQPVGRRAFVGAQLDGLALLSRWTGRLDRDPVWTSPRFAAALGFNAGVRFP